MKPELISSEEQTISIGSFVDFLRQVNHLMPKIILVGKKESPDDHTSVTEYSFFVGQERKGVYLDQVKTEKEAERLDSRIGRLKRVFPDVKILKKPQNQP